MTISKQFRIAVLLSGSGTTLQNLLHQIDGNRLPCLIASVLSSRPDAYGLVRAQKAGIPTAVIDRKKISSVEGFSNQIFEECRRHQVDLVVMAGFLHLLRIPEDFVNRVMNIHPSLIPAFCGKGFHGLHVHQAVIESGVKITGCTVHYADNQYDHGPIILQQAVLVADDDTATTLAERVFTAETHAYPEAIRLHFQGRLQVQGRRVCIIPS